MTARADIQRDAAVLGWEHHATRQGDTFVRGDLMVAVDYRADGAVNDGQIYHFFSIDNLKLRDRTGSHHKKELVLAWLAE